MILRQAYDAGDNQRLAHLCGSLDENLRAIEDTLGVRVSRRGATFRVEGDRDDTERAMRVLDALYAKAAQPLAPEAVQLALVEAAATPAAGDGAGGANGGDAAAEASPGAPAPPVLRTRHADLQPRTPNQRRYLKNIVGHDITFGIGPAGTGKTFLAVACAVDALERSAVQRIILTRPAVEAGERLGFLPGDLAQKVDPYLRPLYDALYDLMGYDRVMRAFEKATIEVAPLAFMRGRTLNHAFVILDEAQNTTVEQMKMFLTRLGFGSRAVVNGDVSQIDLPRGTESGLVDAERVLGRVRGIAITHFGAGDVVRHPLVARIVEAYDAARGPAAAPAAGTEGA